MQLNVPNFVTKWKNNNDPHKTFISIQMHKCLKLGENLYIYLQRTITPTERFPNHKASHSRHTTSMRGGGGGGGGGGGTVLVVRASDSGSGDPGSILGRVGVLFP